MVKKRTAVEIEIDIEAMRRESIERRKAHPDWPSHKPTLYEPHIKRTTVFETMPIGKAKHTGYCKYCYKKHSNWWEMDPREGSLIEEEYSPLLLCGECEYTSLKCFT